MYLFWYVYIVYVYCTLFNRNIVLVVVVIVESLLLHLLLHWWIEIPSTQQTKRLKPFLCYSLSLCFAWYQTISFIGSFHSFVSAFPLLCYCYFVVFPLLIHFYLFLRHLDCLRYTNSCNSPRCIDTITTNQYSMPHLLLIYSCLLLQYNLRWLLLPLLHGRYVHIQSAQCHSQSLLLSHTSNRSPVFQSFNQGWLLLRQTFCTSYWYMSRMRWLPSILAFKTYYPDSPSFGIFNTSAWTYRIFSISRQPQHFQCIRLVYFLPDLRTVDVDHISCLRRTLPPLLPFWCMNPYDMPTRLVEIKGSRRRAPLDCTIVDTVGVPFHRHPSRSRLRMHQAPPSLILATIVTTAAIAMLLFTSTIQQQLYLSQSAEGGRHQVDFKLGGLCSSPLKGPTLGPTLRPRAREKGRP